MLATDYEDKMCCWQLWDECFCYFGHQNDFGKNPYLFTSPFNIRYQELNFATIAQKLSITLSHQHQDVINITFENLMVAKGFLKVKITPKTHKIKNPSAFQTVSYQKNGYLPVFAAVVWLLETWLYLWPMTCYLHSAMLNIFFVSSGLFIFLTYLSL